MDTTVIIIAAVVAALLVLATVIWNIRSGKRKKKNQYQNQSKNVLVKNGVDVKKQVLGGEKGEYFTGNLEKRGTYYVNPALTVWRVTFRNLGTEERTYVDFTRQMWIGRIPAGQEGTVKLTIPDDEKVSRNHCTIFENCGVLCLRDLNSSNHTYLNGNIIMSAVALQNGDVLRIGDTQFEVQYCIVNSRLT